MPDTTPPGYLLGEMAATVRSIDSNVTAIRTEMGDLTRRIGDVETDLASLNAERKAMIPDYTQFRTETTKTVHELVTWKNQVDGGVNVAKGGSKLIHVALTAFLTLALFIAGQVWNDRRLAADRSESSQQVVQPH